jgi:hypothetical protein
MKARFEGGPWNETEREIAQPNVIIQFEEIVPNSWRRTGRYARVGCLNMRWLYRWRGWING